MDALTSFVGSFASTWGIVVLAALDSSVLFFAPLANDVVMVALAARHPDRAWLYPVLGTAGSLVGVATTFWLGRTIGDTGLARLMAAKRLARVRRRVEKTGAVALGMLGVIPPPFPFTAIVLAGGALKVKPSLFFPAVAGARLLRYGAEAALAAVYGQRVLAWMDSTPFKAIVGVLIVAAIGGSIVTLARVAGARAGS